MAPFKQNLRRKLAEVPWPHDTTVLRWTPQHSTVFWIHINSLWILDIQGWLLRTKLFCPLTVFPTTCFPTHTWNQGRNTGHEFSHWRDRPNTPSCAAISSKKTFMFIPKHDRCSVSKSHCQLSKGRTFKSWWSPRSKIWIPSTRNLKRKTRNQT